MKIVIIGSGNTAAVLGRKFISAGHSILQVLGRNAKVASELAYEWDTESANYISLISKEADVYLIAVADAAIEEVIKGIWLNDKVVAHTAAAIKMDVLQSITKNYGVFYPLQSLNKEQELLPETPIYIEAANEHTKKTLETLASSISPKSNLTADYDKRLKLHVAAVLVNNFSNHLFSLAEEYCVKEGIHFSELLPLIDNTYSRLNTTSPSKMQTGPAIREDMDTIQKHMALLKEHPQLIQLYRFLTESIMGHALPSNQ